MDSSEEISDNILSYLLDSVRNSDSSFNIEGENVSTATDNDINNGSELDNSLNQVTSASVKSTFSSKKLEWDSSADVGCLPDKTAQFKSKLSALERMALSNSASKLCLDEDEQSLALIAKIDRVLAKSKCTTKNIQRVMRKPQRIPTWPSIDSCSNASTDTVIPVIPELTTKHSTNQQAKTYPSKTKQYLQPSENTSPLKESVAESHTHTRKHSQKAHSGRPKLLRSKTTPVYEEYTSELFITRSVASPDIGLYADNELRDVHIPSTPTNHEESDRDEQGTSQCRCVSVDASEATCPTHVSLSSEHSRRLHQEALGELQVYRGLKEHLQNLKDYVGQLEQTWKLLDRRNASAPHLRSREMTENERAPRSKLKTNQTAPTCDKYQTPSISSRASDDLSTPVNSMASFKSERSFELERLNLHDTDSTEYSRPTRNKPRTKCCNHCSLKTKSMGSFASKKNHDEKSVQTSGQRSRAASIDVVVPQREPIAYDISIEARAKPQERTTKSKITLQDALKEKRPDFYQDSERRRKAIQEISEMRRMGMMDANFTPHLFSYNELRKHTESLYRRLPEFKNRNKDQQRKETVVGNRIKASVFQKKLQSRVLQGQLNLPHSTYL